MEHWDRAVDVFINLYFLLPTDRAVDVFINLSPTDRAVDVFIN